MKLFLIGMPGSGKSYCANILKKKLKIPAYDLDSLIEMMEEQTIAEIFAEGGEDSFRSKETKMLRLFKEKKKFILSCGGGTPCFNNNIEWMNKQGITVWIDEPLEVLASRLMAEKDHRPLIKDKTESELLAYLEKTLEERTQYYSQATHKLTSAELAGAGIQKLMEEYA